MNFSRRSFIQILVLIVLSLSKISKALANGKLIKGDKKTMKNGNLPNRDNHGNLGVSEDGFSYVYMARNGGPEKNMNKVIELMGGIEKVIGKEDIVILKPNAQWWNQGMTNTDAMKAFIEMVMDVPDFNGEIIIAENHHFADENSRGWTTDKRNGRFNYNELIDYFHGKNIKNISKYHWRDGGLNPEPLQGDDGGNGVVDGPGGKDGYVWLEDKIYEAPNGRKCMMTNPVFTSSYSGITIDLMNGAWKDGNYLNVPVKLINYSALNHHGIYVGATASIKNFMGITDMTCGFQGVDPEGYYNVHYVGVSRFMKYKKIIWNTNWRVVKYLYRNFHYTGGALGYFMKHVKKPDLNIITAERVGWGSRTDLKKSAETKTIIASKDPVALDLVASKEILSKATPIDENVLRNLNSGDYKEGPFYKFIKECHKNGVGNLEEGNIKKINFDFMKV